MKNIILTVSFCLFSLALFSQNKLEAPKPEALIHNKMKVSFELKSNSKTNTTKAKQTPTFLEEKIKVKFQKNLKTPMKAKPADAFYANKIKARLVKEGKL